MAITQKINLKSKFWLDSDRLATLGSKGLIFEWLVLGEIYLKIK